MDKKLNLQKDQINQNKGVEITADLKKETSQLWHR